MPNLKIPLAIMKEVFMTDRLTVSDIAKMIDHSLLRPNLTEMEFMEGMELSKKHQVAT